MKTSEPIFRKFQKSPIVPKTGAWDCSSNAIEMKSNGQHMRKNSVICEPILEGEKKFSLTLESKPQPVDTYQIVPLGQMEVDL